MREMGSLGTSGNVTMVCAPVTAETVEEMVGDMNRAKAEGADVVELRLDSLQHFEPSTDLKRLLTAKPLPVIVVYRYDQLCACPIYSLLF